MEKKKDRSMLIISVSLGVLFLAIVITSLIDKGKASQSDIRAKAAVDSGLKYQAVVVSTDGSQRFTVSDVKPVDNESQNYGTWTVTLTPGTSIETPAPGDMVIITAEAKTVDIKGKTMSAKGMTRK